MKHVAELTKWLVKMYCLVWKIRSGIWLHGYPDNENSNMKGANLCTCTSNMTYIMTDFRSFTEHMEKLVQTKEDIKYMLKGYFTLSMARQANYFERLSCIKNTAFNETWKEFYELTRPLWRIYLENTQMDDK
jgi:hypothetical protein